VTIELYTPRKLLENDNQPFSSLAETSILTLLSDICFWYIGSHQLKMAVAKLELPHISACS